MEKRFTTPVVMISLLLMLCVFGGVVVAVTLEMRETVREQMIRRDVDALRAVTLLETRRVRDDFVALGIEPVDEELLTGILGAAELGNVIAVRVFTPGGEFFDAVPDFFLAGEVGANRVSRVLGGEAIGEFHPSAPLSRYFHDPGGEEFEGIFPLLEVVFPLWEEPGGRVLGVGQILLEGSSLEAQFLDLDRSMRDHALMSWGAGSLVITLVFAFAVIGLTRSNRELAARSRELREKNRGLARRLKTAAVGSVVSHLLHGLKNPVASLRLFFGESRSGLPPDFQEDCEEAKAAIERIDSMIREITTVLREMDDDVAVEFSGEELFDLLSERMEPVCAQRSVRLVWCERTPCRHASDVGNLLLLILHNLAQNAAEASPAGADVVVSAEQRADGMAEWRVTDKAGGLPAARAQDPFGGRTSGKGGGSGLGLAISAELAHHAGGNLVLEKTGPEGTVFRIELPAI